MDHEAIACNDTSMPLAHIRVLSPTSMSRQITHAGTDSHITEVDDRHPSGSEECNAQPGDREPRVNGGMKQHALNNSRLHGLQTSTSCQSKIPWFQVCQLEGRDLQVCAGCG